MIGMLGLVTKVISYGAGMGAGRIAEYAIKKVIPQNLGKIDKILVTCGTIALSGVAMNSASTYVEQTVTEIKTAVKTIQEHYETKITKNEKVKVSDKIHPNKV